MLKRIFNSLKKEKFNFNNLIFGLVERKEFEGERIIFMLKKIYEKYIQKYLNLKNNKTEMIKIKQRFDYNFYIFFSKQCKKYEIKSYYSDSSFGYKIMNNFFISYYKTVSIKYFRIMLLYL